ncbi:MAG TPA: hypothetical protein VG347_08450 [Verrucomicrobiae bacterium]|nr:hypothetical protein [Verrucomicrobiae bacterium]
MKKANEFEKIQVNPTESNRLIYDLRMAIYVAPVCRRAITGGLRVLVADESVHLRQGYGGQGVAAAALPPQSKIASGWREFQFNRAAIGNLKSQI